MVFWKDGHAYILRFDKDSIDLAIQTVRCWAESPKVNLTWFDAAIINNCIRQQQGSVTHG